MNHTMQPGQGDGQQAGDHHDVAGRPTAPSTSVRGMPATTAPPSPWGITTTRYRGSPSDAGRR